jgi:hypothetical protein
MFFGVVLVNGRRKRSSSSTDVRPYLKRLYPKKVLLWLWNYLRRLPVHAVRFVTSFVKIETKFDADYLLLKLRYISCKNIAGSLKRNLQKTH